jgi:hypothetical protein
MPYDILPCRHTLGFALPDTFDEDNVIADKKPNTAILYNPELDCIECNFNDINDRHKNLLKDVAIKQVSISEPKESEYCPELPKTFIETYFNKETLKHIAIFVLCCLILKGFELFGMTLINDCFSFLKNGISESHLKIFSAITVILLILYFSDHD